MRKILSYFIFAVLAFGLSFEAYGQSSGSLRKSELERISISKIPIPGYDTPRPGDVPGPIEPAYEYWAYVEAMRDVDTVRGRVDLGFHTSREFDMRFFGIDGFEITRKGGRSASHVKRGYKCRDLMIGWLGSDQVFPEKALYHDFDEPIKIVVKSVKNDKYAKRWLFIIYKDGVNLNQLAARSGCAIVTTFERNPVYYGRETPVTVALD